MEELNEKINWIVNELVKKYPYITIEYEFHKHSNIAFLKLSPDEFLDDEFVINLEANLNLVNKEYIISFLNNNSLINLNNKTILYSPTKKIKKYL